MPLQRETEYGKITISNELLKEVIDDACQKVGKDIVWPANKLNLNGSYDDDERIVLSFSVIIKFGVSINETCKQVSDYIAERIKNRSGNFPSKITINVVGVKSKNVVKRLMEVVCEY